MRPNPREFGEPLAVFALGHVGGKQASSCFDRGKERFKLRRVKARKHEQACKANHGRERFQIRQHVRERKRAQAAPRVGDESPFPRVIDQDDIHARRKLALPRNPRGWESRRATERKHHISGSVLTYLAHERNLSTEARERHRLVERVAAVAKANPLRRHGSLPQLAFVKTFDQRVQMRCSDDGESLFHTSSPPCSSGVSARRSHA